ncbi:MAG: hypothetical protein Q9160_002526 [Pyrenula sp. 1 TL-2023]
MLMRAICAVLAAVAFLTSSVSGEDQKIKGNYYGSGVKAMTVSNFGIPGQFPVVTNMDSNQNKCDKNGQQSFDGGVSPLEEGISWHFRGPIILKQFAAYTITATSSKRSIKPGFQERRHGHSQYHRRGQADQDTPKAVDGDNNQKRDVCRMVTATIDGKVESWMNTYKCTTAPAAPAVQAQNAKNVNGNGSNKTITVTVTVSAATTKTSTTSTLSNNETSTAASALSSSTLVSTTVFRTTTSSNTVTVTDSTSSLSASSSSQSAASSQSTSLSSSQDTPGSQTSSASSSQVSSNPSQNSLVNSAQPSAIAPVSGTWIRQSYYNADQQIADGLVFLNQRGGGNGSGVFD